LWETFCISLDRLVGIINRLGLQVDVTVKLKPATGTARPIAV
jgi:hypothetical protein